MTINGETVDPASSRSPWGPITVDDVFDLIDELAGQRSAVAVFDPTTGAPTDLWFDPVPNGIDDELKVSVDVIPR